MRVLINTASYYPYVSGVSVMTRSLAKALVASGDTPLVIAPADHWGETWRETKPDRAVTVIRIPSVANPFRPGFRTPLISPAAARRLVADLKPDLVHVHDPLPVSWFLLKAAHRRNIPVVGTNHVQLSLIVAYVPGLVRPLVTWFLARYFTWFYNQCDAITVPTHELANAMRASGVTSPIHVLTNGVDVAQFRGSAPHRSTKDHRPLILTVGRVDKEKAVDVVIRAVALLAKQQSVRLVVVGNGGELPRLKQLVAAEQLTKTVTFTGAIPHADPRLAGWYRDADIFVTASPIEAQGIVVLEAMAAGKPIVAANAGALPELVEPNANGFLVNPGDAAGFASALGVLATDSALRKRFGARSRTLVEQHKTTTALPRFIALYRSLVSTPRRHPRGS